MKNTIKFLRGVHPFVFLLVAVMISSVIIFLSYPSGNLELLGEAIFGELIMTTIILVGITFLTHGRSNLNEGYKAEVRIAYLRNERVRWSGHFKSLAFAKFAARWQAWMIDHFGEEHINYGIKYYISPMN